MWPQKYWRSRLEEGRVFFRPDLRLEDVDWKKGEASWPIYVAKDALYLDFLLWKDKITTASVPDSEFFRLVQPYLYPYGRDKHTRRLVTYGVRHAGEGRLVQARKILAFIKMPPLEVMRATYIVATTQATVSERVAYAQVIKNGEQAFLSVARVPHTGHQPPAVV